MTRDEREWGLAQYETLSKLIDEGKWEYSKSKMKTDFFSYQQSTWAETHLVLHWGGIFGTFFLNLFVGWVVLAFIFIIFMFMINLYHKSGRERYEEALQKLKHGRQFYTQSSSEPKSSAGEIAKLHELLKLGAITQEEFDTEKNKIFNKVA